ncbi:MAG TPA: tRNA uridine-5-carboxymethylaminomethyl(34) synthesis GTPase MnmE [Candidatus Megamonas gallistercoris]|nr:tRNA uridine-5-carboxymethylaminomethyl(34) synthesis GTPase MnmE [Candidatus Megamonas gallistercoris]
MRDFADNDTIAAIATPPGEGGIGIVRISGENAGFVVDKFFKAEKKDFSVMNFKTHQAVYGKIIDDKGCIIDEALCIAMWAPNSYTKENVVEIQSHGGSLVVHRILELAINHGARMAQPGEFTKRAFLNGRLDLSQAQSVMDIIQARTDASLRMAAGHLQGAFSEEIQSMRHCILEIIAHLEASIDFPEDDIEDVAKQEAEEKISGIKNRISEILKTFHTGRILREGLMTTIIGKPNVGKSSLLNALLREERAIVTDIPGTTRDSLEEYANIGGVPLRIIDTAGIRETHDKVEQIGVEKSVAYLQRADLILALFDASRPLSQEDRDIIAMLKDKKGIVLLTKKDLPTEMDIEDLQNQLQGEFKYICISTINKDGLKDLEDEIVNRVYSGNAGQAEGCFVNNLRQAEALKAAEEHLEECLNTIRMGMAEDFIVIDVRSAWEKLGEITGDTVDEDIIDQIFSQFCIGK